MTTHKPVKSCSNCEHFEATQELDKGECHRYPPTVIMMMNPLGQPATMSVYPPTMRVHRCGEWAKNEGKPSLPQLN